MTEFCLTQGSTIELGPIRWSARRFTEELARHGLNVSLPAENAGSPIDLDGLKILPVVDVTPAFNEATQVVDSRALTVEPDRVASLRNVSDMNIDAMKAAKIGETYQHAKGLLDAQTAGYSEVEVATWPALQADIIAYNDDSLSIGSAMQSVIDQGIYDAAGLSALLTPKITFKNDVISQRSAHVAAINSKTDLQEIADYDITTGWPA